MRKILATALIIAGTSSAALAADLPSRAAPVFAPPLPPVFTWTGAYFGINGGYAFDDTARFNTANGNAADPAFLGRGGVGFIRPNRRDVNSDGFTAGGQVGYNYQFGAGNGIVVGFEADAAYTDLGQTNSYGPLALTRLHSDMDFLGTVRGRLGYAFDRVFVYGTGGFAYGDVSTDATFYSGPTTASTRTFFGSRSGIETGYTYGGGVEFAIPTDSFLNTLNFFHSSGVTIKAEYLHYDLGEHTYSSAAVAGAGSAGSYITRVRTDGDLARVGINYKF